MIKTYLAKPITLTAFSLLLVNIAYAHQVRFEGGRGSGAAILTEDLIVKASTNSSIKAVATSANEMTVEREDESTQISCYKAFFAYSCRVTMKHGRPLESLDSYPVGNNMTVEGDSQSNAMLIAKLLDQTKDASVVVRGEYSFATRESADVRFSCRTEPANTNSTAGCDIVTKSK